MELYDVQEIYAKHHDLCVHDKDTNFSWHLMNITISVDVYLKFYYDVYRVPRKSPYRSISVMYTQQIIKYD